MVKSYYIEQCVWKILLLGGFLGKLGMLGKLGKLGKLVFSKLLKLLKFLKLLKLPKHYLLSKVRSYKARL